MTRFLLIILAIGMWAAIAYAMPNALDKEYASNQAAVEIHKDSIRTTYISPADQVVIDLTSDDFKKANQHANEFLRANREDKP